MFFTQMVSTNSGTTGSATVAITTTGLQTTIETAEITTRVSTTIAHTVTPDSSGRPHGTDGGYIIPVSVVLVAFTVGALTAILCIFLCRRCRHTSTRCRDVIMQRPHADDRQQLTRTSLKQGNNSNTNPYAEVELEATSGEYMDMTHGEY